ncbi:MULTISPECIES: flavodoxin domain-containing protein [Gordonia]|uniref:flavodoxin domain-containing protein n=1 Tax=Gordonia TaxID=2053 RepID=UPI000A0611B3|nr:MULTISPECIES: flavodoxin domain-containing protein [Gordonia]MDJ0008520.1 flavodoxin domain-containing protein [Gordonia alkanivorans]MDJ0098538.1 flavodoxin domain-containing protein [Gordonia alkanivorans]MDJ0494095.1 flavodoxin domain-containing protein [Gordonia alkanivorans]
MRAKRTVVAYASANGSTKEIADRVADGLRAAGATVHLCDLTAAGPPDHTAIGADHLVIGSAIHNGQWLSAAERFAEMVANERDGPVWAFSVSSVGETSTFLSPRVARFLRPRTPLPRAVAAIEASGTLRDHRKFAGAIAKGDWPGVGRIVFRLMGGDYGDARDWGDVDHWCRQIVDDNR